MGTFLGHFLPGSIFFVLGFWWTIQITRRLLVCRTHGVRFYNSATYPVLMGRWIRWPIEPVVKIIMTTIGMAIELYSSTDMGRAGKVVWMGDIQHVTMYSMFWLSGVVDILVYKGALFAPMGMDYLSASLAFATEGLLFSTHLHGRTGLDVHVHKMLLYAIAACALFSLIEYKFHNSVLVAYTRAYFVLFQGTWFFQVGFILYPPFPSMKLWDEHSTDQMMLATSIFAWHLGGVFLGQMMLISMTSLCSSRACAARKNGYEHTFAEEQRVRVDFNWEQSETHSQGRDGFGYFRLRMSEPEAEAADLHGELSDENVTGRDLAETIIHNGIAETKLD